MRTISFASPSQNVYSTLQSKLTFGVPKVNSSYESAMNSPYTERQIRAGGQYSMSMAGP